MTVPCLRLLKYIQMDEFAKKDGNRSQTLIVGVCELYKADGGLNEGMACVCDNKYVVRCKPTLFNTSSIHDGLRLRIAETLNPSTSSRRTID